MDFTTLLLLMIFGHMLGDYALQSEFMAKGKNRINPIPGIPWIHPMAAHCVIHGGIVGLITGSALLGIAETLIHAATDDAKCRGKISYHMDQGIHIGCKAAWVLILLMTGPLP